jgi:phosphate transport system substrate-binding protein
MKNRRFEMTSTKTRYAVPVLAVAAIAGGVVLAADVSLTAAGATFPEPIYHKWFDTFKTKTGAQINYQGLGSGAGIKQLTEGTVDFGASDRPMTDAEIAKMKVKPMHFPTVLGAVVPAYNVDGNPDIKFTGPVLADIFMGKIKSWDDPALAKINPGVKMPKAPITVAVRSDGSGTSFVFTDYLAKVSPDWKAKVGAPDQLPNWPAGLRQKGSAGVAGTIKQNPNSIGYIELTYALTTKMSFGAVQNAAGKFVKADLASTTAAAAAFTKEMPEDFRVSIVNPQGAAAYPICTFTYLLIPGKFADGAKKKAVTDFLSWMLTTGQESAGALSYAPLPKEVVAKEKKLVATIQ